MPTSRYFHQQIFFLHAGGQKLYRAAIALGDNLWAVAFTKRRSTNFRQITIAITAGTNIGAIAKTVNIQAHLRQRTLAIGYGTIGPACMGSLWRWVGHNVKCRHRNLPDLEKTLFVLII
jgi:hypothetical protein